MKAASEGRWRANPGYTEDGCGLQRFWANACPVNFDAMRGIAGITRHLVQRVGPGVCRLTKWGYSANAVRPDPPIELRHRGLSQWPDPNVA